MIDPLIFIVDDDPVFSNIISMMLRQESYQNTILVSSAEECLELMVKNPVFIFLDYGLEGLNGLEALKQIKEINKEINVFIITSSTNQNLKKECLDIGADLFLNKNEILDGFPSALLNALSKTTSA